MKCTQCFSTDIEFYESAGHAACVQCGMVLEENTIVSSVEFQESGDRSSVVGQFVSASCSKVKRFGTIFYRLVEIFFRHMVQVVGDLVAMVSRESRGKQLLVTRKK